MTSIRYVTNLDLRDRLWIQTRSRRGRKRYDFHQTRHQRYQTRSPWGDKRCLKFSSVHRFLVNVCPFVVLNFGNIIMPKMCTPFGLVPKKSVPILTSCSRTVFWVVFVNASSHLCFGKKKCEWVTRLISTRVLGRFHSEQLILSWISPDLSCDGFGACIPVHKTRRIHILCIMSVNFPNF